MSVCICLCHLTSVHPEVILDMYGILDIVMLCVNLFRVRVCTHVRVHEHDNVERVLSVCCFF